MMMNDDKVRTSDRPLILPSLVLLALFIAAGLLSIDQLWGFNNLRYFPAYFAGIFAFLVLMSLIPGISRAIYKAFQALSKNFLALPRFLQILLVAVVSLAAFYLLRVHVHAFGDGYDRIYKIERQYYFYYSEPLDFLLHAILYRGMNIFISFSGETTYIIYSIACGTAFVLTIFLFDTSGLCDDEHGPLLKWLFISLGGLQLFFGYVESYTLFYLAILLYSLFAARLLMTGKGVIATSLLFILGLSAHLTAVFFLPAYLFMAHAVYKSDKPLSRLTRYFPVIALLAISAILAPLEIWTKVEYGRYITGFRDNFLPLFSLSQYSIFSLEHLFDFLNQILLVAPFSLILLIQLLFVRPRYHLERKYRNFLMVLLASAVLFLLVVDPKLGYARDWDLFALPAAVVGAVVILVYLAKMPLHRLGPQARLIVGFLPLLFLSIWILTNASEKRQLLRAENLLSLSDRSRGYGTELLAYYYHNRAHDDEKALQLLKGITGPAKNARVYGGIAQIELDMGQPNDAFNSALEGMKVDSSSPILPFFAATALSQMGNSRAAVPYYRKASELEPRNPRNLFLLGQAYYEVDSAEAAIKTFKGVIALEPGSAAAHFSVGQSYLSMGNYDSASVYIQNGLRLKPDDTQGWELMDMIKRRNAGRRTN